jgi:GNAT superfamily N-acetyltransferase
MSCAVVEAPVAQTQAVLMLLPELLTAEVLPPRWWVAHLPGRPEALVAAAAFVPRLRDPEAPSFPCLLRVLPAYRRQGIGRALVARLIEDACRWEVDALASWQACEGGDADFLQAVGFKPYLAVYRFVGDLTRALLLCARRERALRAHGRIPVNMQVVPLSEAPLDAVVALYCSHAGVPLATARRRIETALDDQSCRVLSVAALDSSGVAGLLLAAEKQGVPEADLWLSDPGRRNGWVALMTLHASLQRAAQIGATRFRFHCNERALATLNFARSCGAQREAVRHGFRLALPPVPG